MKGLKPEKLLAKIKHEFPDLKFSKWRYIDKGEDNQIIVLDSTWTFRFSRYPKRQRLFEGEVKLLKVLSKKTKAGLPVYRYIDSAKTFGAYKWVAGKEVTNSVFKKMSAKEKDSLARQLADFLTVLGSFSKSAVKQYGLSIGNAEEDTGVFENGFYKMVGSSLSAKDLEKAEKLFAKIKLAQDVPVVYGIEHGDLTQDHILWDAKNNQLNIIDFGDRDWGDLAGNFAGLYEYGDTFVKRVYKYYRGRKDETLLRRARVYYDRIALFDLYYGIKIKKPSLFKAGLKRLRAMK